jgi:hypothetical protein
MSESTLIEAFRVLAAQLAAFEALLLLASALHKVRKWSYSRTVLRHFAGVPPVLTAPLLGLTVAGESLGALLLVLPGYRTAGAILASFLWTVYLALILRAIAGGRSEVDCGCSFGSAQHSLGSFEVSRNAVLLGFATLIACVSAQTGHASIQGSQVLAACALLALYGALDQVMGLRPLRGGEVV